MDFKSTVKGSLLERFYPAGWDMAKIDRCCDHPAESVTERQPFWNRDFAPVVCENVYDFDMMLGHEIAQNIRRTKEAGKKLAMILPVGPMGMYKWAVYFLQEWSVDCSHVYGFNMDEWSDAEGNTLEPTNTGAFQYAMEQAFYGPLGELTVPPEQRNFATKENLPTYAAKIAALKAEGAELITVFGIGRMLHIAFWEPHFAEEYDSVEQWRSDTHRIGAQLHPLTIEQNAITSFKSRTTLVPCRANTVGPGLFLQSDRVIGGCDGALGRGMQWQGMSLWITLRHGPDMWLPSTFMPTLPGKLFFLRELAGPLVAEVN
ncbi:glucosamine-6-phosphate isomerase [Paenibacillus hemerocallicola]|jgi:glucosamine-6-phosphate deaminase|uniref:Glucosamine-6-phosphate isomerase n=1 Tax=Paenibacillus hemerocallicola TaxID=1172614 RepID=A0A5C4T9H3_9BACL|nr:glucosamine-6-phosphate isomerase [Paenibacillus hemerocallicola]TNJ65743.1 glucosamine-6-phosphate isomerase [Paenibacillus hemerocallicola]